MSIQVIAFIFYRLVNAVYTFLLLKLDLLRFPTEKHRSCCFINSILLRGKAFTMDASRPCDFLLNPVTACSPATILLQDRWTPYCLDKDFIYFVDSGPLSEMQAREHSFSFLPQYHNAQHLVRLRRTAFVALCQTMSPPQAVFAYIPNVMRSGTTLLASMMQSGDGRLTSVTELDIMCNLAEIKVEATLPRPTLIDYTRACIQYLGRSLKRGQTLTLKPRHHGTWLIEEVKAALPQSRILFATRRNILKAVQSTERSLSGTRFSSDLLWRWMTNPGRSSARRWITPYFIGYTHWENIFNEDLLQPLYRQRERLGLPQKFTADLAFTLVAESLIPFYRAKQKGVDMMEIFYEDLTANPKATLARIYEYCEISAELLPGGLGTFNVDSQRGTVLSQDKMKLAAISKLTAEELNMYNRTSKEDYGLPVVIE